VLFFAKWSREKKSPVRQISPNVQGCFFAKVAGFLPVVARQGWHHLRR
jgi:hypothetical protein